MLQNSFQSTKIKFNRYIIETKRTKGNVCLF